MAKTLSSNQPEPADISDIQYRHYDDKDFAPVHRDIITDKKEAEELADRINKQPFHEARVYTIRKDKVEMVNGKPEPVLDKDGKQTKEDVGYRVYEHVQAGA